jgi:amino acid adenylation domain-containing protein
MDQHLELRPLDQVEIHQYPLTGLQTGLVIQALTNPTSALDIVQVVCSLYGRIDPQRHRIAWNRAVQRHDGLRLAFQTENLEGPTQSVFPPFSVDVPLIDWSGKSEDQKKRDLVDWLDQDRAASFRLDIPPLFRVSLIQLDPERFQLVWTFHHLILDGRSIPIVLRDVLGDTFSSLPLETNNVVSGPLYRDYLRWLGEQDSSLAKEFWKQYLSEFLSPTPLPLYDAKGSLDSSVMPIEALQVVEGELDLAATNTLRAQAEKIGVTISTLLHATWAFILARASGVERVCYGTARSCRYGTIPLALQTAGMFTNTIPMLVQVPESESIVNWLKQIRDLQHQLRPFEHTGLTQIRSELSLGTTAPLFESLLGIETQDLLSELSISAIDPSIPTNPSDYKSTEKKHLKAIEVRQHTGIPLTIAARLTDRLHLRFSYDNRRFSRTAIERTYHQFIHVLRAIARNPIDTLVSSLESLPEDQWREQAIHFNEHCPKITAFTPLHRDFHRQSLETPDLIAIESMELQVTYRELASWSAGVMHLLTTMGVQVGASIGIWMPPSAAGIAAILGILGRGAYYVPLPFDAPPSRLEMIVNDAGLKIVFCISPPAFAGQIPDVLWIAIPERSNHEWTNHVEEDDIDRMFCIIYTSGTTGVPKGVSLTHRGFANVMHHRTKVRFLLGDFACSPLTSPWHFDGSIVQMFSPLITGGKLYICNSVHELASSETYHSLTALTGASTLIGELIRQHGSPRAVRVVGLGAEPVPPDLLEMLILSPRFERLITGYGVTECSCYSTDHLLYDRSSGKNCNASNSKGERSNNIGRPITNSQIYVLDKKMRPVPIGSIGEIFIGGLGVSQGYLKRPELTAEKFISDPANPTSSLKVYRTGDLGRWRDNGSLEFVGRLDHQIKLRGHRIEPGDIQTVLCQFPNIQQACIVLREDRQQHQRLIAYCVVPQDISINLANLRKHLNSKLPVYMVPDFIKILNNFPLTSGGKIDFDRLPDVNQVDDIERLAYTPPRTDMEEKLVRIWEEILEIKGIGIHENFFEIGGDSLSAVKLFAMIKKQFEKTLPLAILYTESTIEQLSKRIENHKTQSPFASLIPLHRSGQGDPLIVMPSLFGELMYAKPLVDALDAKIPVLGLQPNLISENQVFFKDFRRTAFEYTKILRSQYPHGPYSLIGYSYGGLLAFEIARQLQLQNQRIKILAIIDTGPEQRIKKTSTVAKWSHFGRVLSNAPNWLIENLDPATIVSVCKLASKKLRLALRNRKGSASNLLGLNDLFDTQKFSQENYAILDSCFAGFQTYVPEQYEGTLTLFRANSRPLLHSLSKDLGWKQFCNEVVVHRLQANHETVIHPPSVTSIASVLHEALR